MLSEYAVEPEAIGADWRTFKDLIDRFGADKGRLISRFPDKWEKKVVQAAKNAGVPDVRMTDIVERLRSSKHKVGDFNRTYEHEASWINNALREHAFRPFKAIIGDAGKAACAVGLHPDDCTDADVLFSAATSRDVIRTADEIADALQTIVAVSREVHIVDPFFDLRPAAGKYLPTMTALFASIAGGPGHPKALKVHFRDHHSRPPANILARDGSALVKGLIPAGFSLELYSWVQVPGGEDFHDRFVLTELGGIMIGPGLSAEGPGESAAFTFLNFEHSQSLRSRFQPGSTIYARSGSAVRIRADGSTELF